MTTRVKVAVAAFAFAVGALVGASVPASAEVMPHGFGTSATMPRI